MHNDDRPVRRVLSRRELAALFGAPVAVAMRRPTQAGTPVALAEAAPVPPATPNCVAQPQQTEGPYFVDERLKRADLRSDPGTGNITAGARLDLRFVMLNVAADGGCAPLAGAQVDIWHCDAAGVYSDVRDHRVDTMGQQFLRGFQISDARGHVRFTTVYPGWYPGRAVHVHFKIRTAGADGHIDEFTSQLYFPDDLTDRVHARAPYSARKGQRLLNARDMIFREAGTQLLLSVLADGDGYTATFTIAMRPGEPPPRLFGPGDRRRPGPGSPGRPPGPPELDL